MKMHGLCILSSEYRVGIIHVLSSSSLQNLSLFNGIDNQWSRKQPERLASEPLRAFDFQINWRKLDIQMACFHQVAATQKLPKDSAFLVSTPGAGTAQFILYLLTFHMLSASSVSLGPGNEESKLTIQHNHNFCSGPSWEAQTPSRKPSQHI